MAIGYDAQGRPVHLPQRDRGQGNRITQGMVQGFGDQPLAGVSERDRANYPALSGYLDPVAKSLNFVGRLPGAVAGGLTGTVGAGAQYLTGDSGVANEAENAFRSGMEYFGTRGMAEPGMTPSARIPRSGEILLPEAGGTAQLGYRGPTVLDQYRGLPPGAIRGTSAEGAPRLAAPNPLAEYRQTVNFDYGIGPKRPSEAYRPVIDQTYTLPEELNRRPEVTTDASGASRLGSESPQADQALAMAQQRARDAEAKFVSEQQARATGEGMRERPGTDFNMVGSSYDPMGRALQPTYTGTSATSAAAPRSFLNQPGNLPMLSEQGFGAPSVAQNRALALTDRSGGNLVPGAPNYLEGEFSVVHPDLAVSGSSPSAIAGSNMPRLGAAGAPMADVAAGPGAFSSMPMRPITATGTIGASMLAKGMSDTAGPVQGPSEFQGPPEMQGPSEMQGPPMPSEVHPAVQAARARAIPLPPSRELQAQARADQRPAGGGLASLFNQPLSTKQLNQQSIDNPDDAGAWMRAERQYAATHKDNPNFDLTKLDPNTGMNRGGTASGKSGKVPDPVHKALEIIHHLLMRQ